MDKPETQLKLTNHLILHSCGHLSVAREPASDNEVEAASKVPCPSCQQQQIA